MSNFSSEEMGVPTNLVLASWTDRFIAWLIDFIIVSIGLAVLFAALSLPFWFDNNMVRAYKSIEPLHYLVSSIVFLAYWTYFEFKTGQSIGKRLLHLRTTDLSGKLIDAKTAQRDGCDLWKKGEHVSHRSGSNAVERDAP